jgi:hypothetical protein
MINYKLKTPIKHPYQNQINNRSTPIKKLPSKPDQQPIAPYQP